MYFILPLFLSLFSTILAQNCAYNDALAIQMQQIQKAAQDQAVQLSGLASATAAADVQGYVNQLAQLNQNLGQNMLQLQNHILLLERKLRELL